MQCLLVAAGVYGCRKAPEPNCKGEISMTQQWSRRRRTKVPTAAKADEVIPSYRLNSPTPTADQVEEENLQLPTVVRAEEGNTLLQVIAVGQMVLASPERQTVYAMEEQTSIPSTEVQRSEKSDTEYITMKLILPDRNLTICNL